MGVIKSGKVVIVLQGRFAGRKAIVVKAYDDGNAERRFRARHGRGHRPRAAER